MSTAYRIPFGATALAIGIENVPDPEPMSATISPGFSRSFAITSGIFASIPRSREFIVSMYFSAGDCASCAKALPAVNTQPTQETHTDICLSILGSPEPADDLIPSRREKSIRSTGLSHTGSSRECCIAVRTCFEKLPNRRITRSIALCLRSATWSASSRRQIYYFPTRQNSISSYCIVRYREAWIGKEKRTLLQI